MNSSKTGTDKHRSGVWWRPGARDDIAIGAVDRRAAATIVAIFQSPLQFAARRGSAPGADEQHFLNSDGGSIIRSIELRTRPRPYSVSGNHRRVSPPPVNR